MLWLLLAAPILVLLYAWIQQRRRRIAASYSSFGLAPGSPAVTPGTRRHIAPLLFLVSILILIFSLARPQFVVSIPNVEGTVILAFDVSGSMAADDFKPTRMEAAKNVAREFIQRQPASVLIGIVVFSDGGFSVLKPTNDQVEILAAIDQLEPERGTSLANGIFVSLDSIATELGQASLLASGDEATGVTPTPVPQGEYSPAVIVLLTDGENTVSPDPLEAAHVAADRGVRIHTIGIGSAAGVVLQINDFVVHTQLDEAMLKQISAVTGGAYYNATNEESLLEIYKNIDLELVVKQQNMEVTSLLAGASILLLLIGGMLSLLWFNRMP
jgi:Ca-activated chloride channel family protein